MTTTATPKKKKKNVGNTILKVLKGAVQLLPAIVQIFRKK